MRPILLSLSRMVMMDTTQGAGTPILAATSPEALKNPEKYKGAYMEPIGKISKTSKTAENAALGTGAMDDDGNDVGRDGDLID